MSKERHFILQEVFDIEDPSGTTVRCKSEDGAVWYVKKDRIMNAQDMVDKALNLVEDIIEIGFPKQNEIYWGIKNKCWIRATANHVSRPSIIWVGGHHKTEGYKSREEWIADMPKITACNLMSRDDLRSYQKHMEIWFRNEPLENR